jgi:hypothetical protein
VEMRRRMTQRHLAMRLAGRADNAATRWRCSPTGVARTVTQRGREVFYVMRVSSTGARDRRCPVWLPDPVPRHQQGAGSVSGQI